MTNFNKNLKLSFVILPTSFILFQNAFKLKFFLKINKHINRIY